MNTNDDILLLEQVKKNDKKAFESLFKKYYGKLCGFAFTFLNDKDTSEEIVQQVLINIWAKRGAIIITATLQAYLYASVRNRAMNFVQQHKNFVEIDENLLNEEHHVLTNIEVQHPDIYSAIKQAIEKLPTRCGQIFRLSRFEGLSYAEIAEYLNLSTKTVEVQMGIALKSMREMLKPLYESLKDKTD